jgi:flagellar biosynthesis protein FliR
MTPLADPLSSGAVPIGQLLDWAPAFAIILARVGASMAVLPGLGESSVLAPVRIGLALAITLLLVPILAPGLPPVPDSGVIMALMVAGEVITGLWFGWLARMVALALPVGIQFVAYLLGLSTVLQPDADLGAQSTALAKLFDLAVPVILLSTGLYQVPLRALAGLYGVIPAGHLLPVGDGAQSAVKAVGTLFSLALQIASPFIVAAVAWHVAMGQIARVMSRVQIFFVMMPGQILGGLALLTIVAGAMVQAWQQAAGTWFAGLPGLG